MQEDEFASGHLVQEQEDEFVVEQNLYFEKRSPLILLHSGQKQTQLRLEQSNLKIKENLS